MAANEPNPVHCHTLENTMKYTQTKFVTLTSLESCPPKPGQWVMVDGAIRGQYLGKTKAGVIVVRYQNGKFGKLADTKSNHHLRQFAKVNGAK
jgi:hypothetical protein